MNNETKHTKGPLIVRQASTLGPYSYTVEKVSDGLRSIVARCEDAWICDEHGGTAYENAMLFAAAPDMLEALKVAQLHLEQCQGRDTDWQIVTDAIAKAEGKE